MRVEEFRSFVGLRGPALRRAAYLLCGNWHDAEDLTQTALTKMFLAWPRVRPATAEAYARRVLVRCFLDTTRRPWRREAPVDAVPDRPAPQAVAEDADTRLAVASLLRELAPGQRAVLVLRFWEDLSIAQTAETLGCTEGTVKSQTSKGLAVLRRALAEAGLPPYGGEPT
jgi:RNA polymerase sigma-70 factor (sigma-E family)